MFYKHQLSFLLVFSTTKKKKKLSTVADGGWGVGGVIMHCLRHFYSRKVIPFSVPVTPGLYEEMVDIQALVI